jgi:GntR family transcriptional regulator, galactonate operon transcriptional repressor
MKYYYMPQRIIAPMTPTVDPPEATRPARAAMRGLHGQVVEQLGARIVSGRIPEREVLDVVALEEELDVSRTVLREALRVLGAKGLVDARPKIGTYVRARSEWQLFDADVLRWAFADASPSLLNDLDAVRRIVEPAIAEMAAAHRDDDDLRRLEQALEAMRTAGKDAEAATTADLAFHRALATASHNELLPTIQEVILIGLRARDLVVHASVPGEEAIGLHAEVLEAVRAGDATEAEARMRKLLDVAVRDAKATARRRKRR